MGKNILFLVLFSLFVSVPCALAQSGEMKGIVLSEEDGQPVIGATVSIVGTTVKTVTDANGVFTFSQWKAGDKISVSYLGMVGRTVAASKELTIRLKTDAKQLGEVVVTGIYTRKAESYTGAAATVTGKELKRVGKDRKSTRLNSSHANISYAVFCLKKKKIHNDNLRDHS